MTSRNTRALRHPRIVLIFRLDTGKFSLAIFLFIFIFIILFFIIILLLLFYYYYYFIILLFYLLYARIVGYLLTISFHPDGTG